MKGPPASGRAFQGEGAAQAMRATEEQDEPTMGFLSKLLSMGEGKQLKGYEDQAARINALEPAMQALSDDELRGLTAAFRERSGASRSTTCCPRPSPPCARLRCAPSGCGTSTCSSSAAWR